MFIVLLLLPKLTHAQSWQWANKAGSSDDEWASCITTDPWGYIYIAGGYSSPTITFGSFTLTNTGSLFNTFLVKYTSTGEVVWAKTISGSNTNNANSVCADMEGNVYMAGVFSSSTLTFGSTTLVNDSAGGYADVYLVKYDSAGNVKWAKSAGGTKSDFVNSACTDTKGNIYITGGFSSSSIDFGTAILINDTTNTTTDIYVAKYDSLGNMQWARRVGGKGGDIASSICSDNLDNIYVSGSFTSPKIIMGATTFTNSGIYDICLLKYDNLGGLLWGLTAGGSGSDYASAVTTNASGEVYLTGRYNSPSVTFGATSVINSNSGTTDVYIVKYNTEGTVIWSQSIGGAGNNDPSSIAVDLSDNIFIAGSSSSGFSAGSTMLPAGVFLLKYSHSGSLVWAKGAAGGYWASAYGVIKDANNNGYITGAFNSTTISFDINTLVNTNTRNDIFLAKFTELATETLPIPLSSDLTLHPNPAQNSITLSAPNHITTVSISNIFGQIVHYGKYKTKTVQVNISNFPAGIYTIMINGVERRNFVKE